MAISLWLTIDRELALLCSMLLVLPTPPGRIDAATRAATKLVAPLRKNKVVENHRETSKHRRVERRKYICRTLGVAHEKTETKKRNTHLGYWLR